MNKEKIVIKKMTAKDFNLVSKLYFEVYQNNQVNEKWTTSKAKKLIKQLYISQPDLAFIAQIDKKIIGGFLAEIKPWWDGNHLIVEEIFVAKNYQKNKIGTELTKTVLNLALKKYQIVKISLTTFKNLAFPFSWYKSLGFENSKNLVLMQAKPKNILSKLNQK